MPVVGSYENLETSLERSQALAIAISTAKIPDERIRRIREIAQRCSVAVYRFGIRFEEEAAAGRTGAPLVVVPPADGAAVNKS